MALDEELIKEEAEKIRACLNDAANRDPVVCFVIGEFENATVLRYTLSSNEENGEEKPEYVFAGAKELRVSEAEELKKFMGEKYYDKLIKGGLNNLRPKK